MEVKFDVLVCILVFLFSGLGTSIPIPTQTGYQFTSTLPGINAIKKTWKIYTVEPLYSKLPEMKHLCIEDIPNCAL